MPALPERRRPPWPFGVATVVLFAGFAAVWALAWLVHGLGTCGEDSEISASDYDRLCESGGSIVRNLELVGGAAVLATLALGIVAVRQRTAWPVLTLAALLTAAAVAGFAADRY
jgi:hypothetical protein